MLLAEFVNGDGQGYVLEFIHLLAVGVARTPDHNNREEWPQSVQYNILYCISQNTGYENILATSVTSAVTHSNKYLTSANIILDQVQTFIFPPGPY